MFEKSNFERFFKHPAPVVPCLFAAQPRGILSDRGAAARISGFASTAINPMCLMYAAFAPKRKSVVAAALYSDHDHVVLGTEVPVGLQHELQVQLLSDRLEKS